MREDPAEAKIFFRQRGRACTRVCPLKSFQQDRLGFSTFFRLILHYLPTVNPLFIQLFELKKAEIFVFDKTGIKTKIGNNT